jgi:DNA-binding MltR family transcriptional regulator
MNRYPPKPTHRPPTPRFKNRKKQSQQHDEKNHVPPNFEAIMEEVAKQSDRGAAIIYASLLEKVLETLIIKRLRPLSSNQKNALFGRMAPLSTFAAKIELGFAIGLYSRNAYENLNMVREVRNKFAHKFEPLTFEHKKIIELIHKPDRMHTISKASATPKAEFILTCSILGALFFALAEDDICISEVGVTHFASLSAIGREIKKVMDNEQRKRPPPNQRPENVEPKP